MADSFVFYASFAEAMDALDNEQYGKLMRAINNYALFDKVPDLDGVPKMLFTLIKPQIDANKKRRENAKKGGAPSGNNNAQKQPTDIPPEEKKQPSVVSTETKKQPNDNVNAKDNANEKGNDNDLPEPPSGVSDIPPAEPQKTKINRVTPPDKALELAHLLATLHKNYDSAYSPSEKHIATWATDIDKLNRIDKRSYDDIEQVIRWVKTDGNFWLPNIMSGSKLREKFPVLYVQMIHPHTSRGGSPPKNHGMDGDQSQQSKARALVESWKTGVYA